MSGVLGISCVWDALVRLLGAESGVRESVQVRCLEVASAFLRNFYICHDVDIGALVSLLCSRLLQRSPQLPLRIRRQYYIVLSSVRHHLSSLSYMYHLLTSSSTRVSRVFTSSTTLY